MLVAYAFGYERTSPLFSIQAYRHITRPVEVNPWLHRIGRGTFPNAVSKLGRAADAATSPTDPLPDGTKRVSGAAVGTGEAVSADLKDATERSVVTAQSSENLREIPTDSVHLVLTDPPYGDNVNYSELSDFYLAWHQVLGIAPGRYAAETASAPLEQNLATGGRTEEALEPYREGLLAVFRETRRALVPGGRLVFTFHHIDPRPWEALARALGSAGFQVENTLPLRGEGRGGLKSHPGTIKWDAVLVCRPRRREATVDSPHLTREELDHVKGKTRSWADRLDDPELEFRSPDILNLQRAIMLKNGLNPRGDIPLSQALKDAGEDHVTREEVSDAGTP
jgi:SAM-dependent methyltransferase